MRITGLPADVVSRADMPVIVTEPSVLGVHAQIREYEGQSSGVNDARAQAKAASSNTHDLEQEVQEAWEEMQTQRAIVDKCVSRILVFSSYFMESFTTNCGEGFKHLAVVATSSLATLYRTVLLWRRAAFKVCSDMRNHPITSPRLFT